MQTGLLASGEVTPEDLVLHEADVASKQPEVRADGKVLVHVIRPCVGRGRGRHLYTAEMLEANAEKFTGWPMYVDHLSPAARKAAGGLPRSLRDLGGWIEESWWDSTVPADPARGFDQGAVVGVAEPFGLAEALIKRRPQVVKTSISAAATGARPVLHKGQRVMLVEGIADNGSVDWVTEAGAGGEIVALMEAVMEEYGETDLASMDDDEFRAYMERERPGLAEALDTHSTTTAEGGDDMGDITPEMLQEALATEGGQEVLNVIIEKGINERLPALVEAALDSEREVIRAESDAIANRRVVLRDMRDEAHRTIQESKLPDSWKTKLQERYVLSEGGEPSTALDVTDEVDGEGKVTKTAQAVLREAVEADLATHREMLQEARPTRVRGQGAVQVQTPEKDEGGKEKLQETPEGGGEKKHVGTLYGSLLQEAHIDPATAWDRV